MRISRCIAGLMCAVAVSSGSAAQAEAQSGDFNAAIVEAVNYLNAKYTRGGYGPYSFTHDLPYIGGVISKTAPSDKLPAPSMCVAAMKEVILTAIWLYTKGGEDKARVQLVLSKGADLAFWKRTSATGITPYLYLYGEVSSAGTADALSKFGMGEPVPFSKLKSGDFVNLNRSTTKPTGHAVVFLGYLLPKAELTHVYSDQVVGFRYFSDQGIGRSDAGLGFRNGFFNGHCEADTDGIVSDCKIISSTNPRLLNTGRMWAPSRWEITSKVAALRASISKDISDQNPGITKGLIDEEIDRNLVENVPEKYLIAP